MEKQTPIAVSGRWGGALQRARACSAVEEAYALIAAQYASPLLIGPPVNLALMDLVRHLFTEEEANLVQYLPIPFGCMAGEVAVRGGCSLEMALHILDGLADEKGVLFAFGQGATRRYCLLPLVPGTFEMVLMRVEENGLNDWHREFVHLFRLVFEGGYFGEYVRRPVPVLTYVPVHQALDGRSLAMPSNFLGELFDRYQVFGVSLCQCRIAAGLENVGCGKPLETCVTFGVLAELLIQRGKLRRISRNEALQIKAEAEQAGLVTFVAAANLQPNVGGLSSGTSCSCCADCCYPMKLLRQLHQPGIAAPPRFRPQWDLKRCGLCGLCVKACPVGALQLEGGGIEYFPQRCIGCGLCAAACRVRHALQMHPVDVLHRPPPGVWQVLERCLPNYLHNVWRVMRSRLHT